MNINSRVIGSIQPIGGPAITGKKETPDARGSGAIQTTSTAPQKDSVQISDAGRAKSASTSITGLDPERAAQIHERILQGAYNSLEVVDVVAKRILASFTSATDGEAAAGTNAAEH
ncbi:hypothetical protein BH09GEM1_BH09GEM1_12440 [soil metagenome]